MALISFVYEGIDCTFFSVVTCNLKDNWERAFHGVLKSVVHPGYSIGMIDITGTQLLFGSNYM